MTGEKVNGTLVIKLNQGTTKKGYSLHYDQSRWQADQRVFLAKLISYYWDLKEGVH